MPTIGEVYNPLIEAAINNDPKGITLLAELADTLCQRNHDKTSEQCLAEARTNLDYYCQYFSDEVIKRVKEFYRLGDSFRMLNGEKL
jgi:hypothetical protein